MGGNQNCASCGIPLNGEKWRISALCQVECKIDDKSSWVNSRDEYIGVYCPFCFQHKKNDLNK